MVGGGSSPADSRKVWACIHMCAWTSTEVERLGVPKSTGLEDPGCANHIQVQSQAVLSLTQASFLSAIDSFLWLEQPSLWLLLKKKKRQSSHCDLSLVPVCEDRGRTQALASNSVYPHWRRETPIDLWTAFVSQDKFELSCLKDT